MKDEIKEILEIRSVEQQAIDNLKAIIKCDDKIIEIEPPLEDTAQILLDYITNLQEENEKLKQFYDKKGVYSLEYDKETLTTMVCELQLRIEKAIEYIKEDIYVEPNELYGLVDGEHLLNILQGVGKE